MRLMSNAPRKISAMPAKYINALTHQASSKNAPANSAITGILAPQGIKGASIAVALRSRSLRMVRLAIMPGTAQPTVITKGITDFRFNEVGIINAMLESAQKKYVLADSSKFESVSCVNICSLSKIDGFLTDKFLADDIYALYEKRGCKLYTN